MSAIVGMLGYLWGLFAKLMMLCIRPTVKRPKGSMAIQHPLLLLPATQLAQKVRWFDSRATWLTPCDPAARQGNNVGGARAALH